MGQIIAAKSDDIGLVDLLRIRFQLDKGARRFAPFFIWPSDDGASQYGRMLVQRPCRLISILALTDNIQAGFRNLNQFWVVWLVILLQIDLF